MERWCYRSFGCALTLIALSIQISRAEVEANPYGSIVDRNPFGLKPPPPPAPPPAPTAQPVPMAKITLTGLLTTFGEPRALLEIVEEPGKGGGTPKRPPPIREGERHGAVEILSIDVVKSTVRLRNSGVETNITFEVAKSGPAPAVAGVPGAPPVLTYPVNVPPPSPLPGGAPPSNPGSPNQPSPGGVTLMGGSTPSPAPPSVLGSFDASKRSIPGRPVRAENPYPAPPPPPGTQ